MDLPGREGQNVEYKEAVSNFHDISRAACAFANSSGGVIRVGISDDLVEIGIPEAEVDSLQLRLTGALQCISPMPDHEIRVDRNHGRTTIAVTVSALPNESFCTHQGVVYIRSGSANVKLEGQGLLNHIMERGIVRYDARFSDSDILDIDAKRVESYLARRSSRVAFAESDLKDYLVNLGVAKIDVRLRLRNAALLFFAKDPRIAVPQAEIKLARFVGREPVEIIDKCFATGTILDNLDAAESFIAKNIRTGYKIEGMYRKDVPEYPLDVIRELLANAIVHRDYFDPNSIQINIFSDRLEIINPGRLLPGLSISTLGCLSIQRNPIVYQLMRDIGIVEGLATGIPMIWSTLMKNDQPQPKFEEIGGFFRVTLYNREGALLQGLNPRQKKAMSRLRESGTITTGEYMEMNMVSRPTAFRELSSIVRQGVISPVGKGRNAKYELRM